MEARAKSFTFLSNEGLVRIPFFQRGYVWGEENWGDLLSDLRNPSRTHFLGSLILKQTAPRSGEAKEVQVIDGQQRLTTLSVMLKALYDSLTPETKANCGNSIRNNLFHKKYQTDAEYLIKIQHSHIDAPAYEAVIRYGIDNKETIPKNSSNGILECYRYMIGEFGKMMDQEKKELFNSILDPENKMLVVIDLEVEDDEQAIFDTINSAGIRLTSADIVKNALFQRAIQLSGAQVAISLYDSTWKDVFLSDEATVAFWETERLTGRLHRDNLEILLHSLAVIKGFYDPEKHTLANLSSLYKDRIQRFSTAAELKLFLEEIKDYADIYKKRIPTFKRETLFRFDDSVQRMFHVLDNLQISTFHPFILYTLKTSAADPLRVELILSQLESLVVRRMITSEETKSYNKLCVEFIESPDKLSSKVRDITDEDVTSGLRMKISNKNASLILFWIELSRRAKDPRFDSVEKKFVYSLEHIMPQKWEEYWTEIPAKKDTGGSIMQTELSRADRTAKIYWIGNMTLLTSSLNSSLRNHSISKKIEGEGQKKGMRDYADLSITKDDVITPFEKGDRVWDEYKIVRRTEALTKEIIDIWKA